MKNRFLFSIASFFLICIFALCYSCSADVVWGNQTLISDKIQSSSLEASEAVSSSNASSEENSALPKVTYTFYSQKLSENSDAKVASYNMTLGSRFSTTYSEVTSSVGYQYLPALYSDFTNAMNPGYYVSSWCYYRPDNEDATYEGFTKYEIENTKNYGSIEDGIYSWYSQTKNYSYALQYEKDDSKIDLILENHQLYEDYIWNSEQNEYELSSSNESVDISGIVTKYKLSFVALGWLPRDDTEYKVYHYVEKPNVENPTTENDYDLYTTETFYGITDSIVCVYPLSDASSDFYSTFELDSENSENGGNFKEITILGDGSSSTKFFYNRKSYSFTVNAGDGGYIVSDSSATSTSETQYSKILKAGSPIDLASLVTKDGYRVKEWTEKNTTENTEKTYSSSEAPTVMPSFDVEYTPIWEVVPIEYKLTYHIISNSNENNVLTLSTEQANNLSLPTVHKNTENTTLSSLTFNDGETSFAESITSSGFSNSVSFEGFYLDSACGTPVSSISTSYTIAADSISDDTSIYIKLKVDHVYVDPANGDDSNFAFSVTSPVKSVDEAKKWLKDASVLNSYSNGSSTSTTSGLTGVPVLYVLSSITSATDISSLDKLSLSSSSSSGESGGYGGAALKRHPSFTSGSLINLSSGTATASYLTIDGGANIDLSPVFNQTTTDFSSLENGGVKSTSALVTVAQNASLTLENANLQNSDNTSTSGSVWAGSIFANGTVTLKNCNISCNRAKTAGAIYCASTSVVYVEESTFQYNLATGGNGGAILVDSEKGSESGKELNAYFKNSTFKYSQAENGGAIAINSGKFCSIDGCTFNQNGVYSSNNNCGFECYVAGSLYLSGECSFDYDIYSTTDNPITVFGDFSLSSNSSTGSSVIITPSTYLRKNSSGVLENESVTILSSPSGSSISGKVSLFTLADNTNYEITSEGKISAKSTTSTVSLYSPECYKVLYSLTDSSSSTQVSIKIMENSSTDSTSSTWTEVSASSIKSISVEVFDGTDVVATFSSASFTYPSYLDSEITDSTFRVSYTIKIDGVEYSYVNYAQKEE